MPTLAAVGDLEEVGLEGEVGDVPAQTTAVSLAIATATSLATAEV